MDIEKASGKWEYGWPLWPYVNTKACHALGWGMDVIKQEPQKAQQIYLDQLQGVMSHVCFRKATVSIFTHCFSAGKPPSKQRFAGINFTEWGPRHIHVTNRYAGVIFWRRLSDQHCLGEKSWFPNKWPKSPKGIPKYLWKTELASHLFISWQSGEVELP